MSQNVKAGFANFKMVKTFKYQPAVPKLMYVPFRRSNFLMLASKPSID
jgi:hypothetical protein